MVKIGTIDWAERTGGVITDEDRDQLSGRLGEVFEAAAIPAPDPPFDATFESLAPPDSDFCVEATALWNLVAPDWLANHGHRTWYFARALAEIDQLSPDPELLYVACVLHDLGLTKHAVPSTAIPCFAVNGGREAGIFSATHRSAADAALVREAITMHLNQAVSLEDGELNYLVAAGTLVDIAGPRLQLFPTELIAAILVEYPRGEFGQKIGDVMDKCGTRYPDTRCGYIKDNLNLGALAREHPLDL